jgi:AcrR family transcriptional regulator
MPPKVKTTRDNILDAALETIREKGADRLNARELAKALHCSVQPIFRSFGSMDVLKSELYQKAEAAFHDTMAREVQRHGIPFLGERLAFIEFANDEKNLYRFLFLSGESEHKSLFDRMVEETSREEISAIMGMTGLDEERARHLFADLWLITRGLSALVATSRCEFSEEETVSMLNVLVDSFLGIQHELAKQKPKE